MAKQTLDKKNSLYAPSFVETWKEQSLYSLADWINGMAFRNFNFTSKGKPVIKIAEIKNGISKQTKFTDRRYDEIYFLKKGDMLFCWSGQPETSIDVFWWQGPEGWLNQHIFKVIPKIESKLFFFYLLKYLKPNFIQIAINKQTTGLGHVTKGDLQRFIVKLPIWGEQRAIAAVLSSLDDKIELLREQNKTLEATAQAIYKEWFVKFNFPGATKKLVDSELGKIPAGWRVEKLADLVNLTIGRTPPRKEPEWFSFNPHDVKWLSIKDLGESGTYVLKTSEFLTREAIEKHRMNVVPKNTVVISFKLTVGRVVITLEEMTTNEAIAHLRLSQDSEVTAEFLYLFFKAFDFNSIGSTSSIATAFNSKSLRVLDVLVPAGDIVQKFDQATKPIFKKIANNIYQVQTLSSLRDALLPKLIKGEVRAKGFSK